MKYHINIILVLVTSLMLLIEGSQISQVFGYITQDDPSLVNKIAEEQDVVVNSVKTNNTENTLHSSMFNNTKSPQQLRTLGSNPKLVQDNSNLNISEPSNNINSTTNSVNNFKTNNLSLNEDDTILHKINPNLNRINDVSKALKSSRQKRSYGFITRFIGQMLLTEAAFEGINLIKECIKGAPYCTMNPPKNEDLPYPDIIYGEPFLF